VTEFIAKGSLSALLKSVGDTIDVPQRLEMAIQAGAGMAYLAERDIVHGDLACRNLLVTEGNAIKISDFGMSYIPELMDDDDDDNLSPKAIPVRWAAVEVMEGRRATSKSDVWSFAVVIWEILESSDMPFGTMTNKEVVMRVKDGHRLAQPHTCSDDLYALLRKCWNPEPNLRPSFVEIVKELKSLKQQHVSYPYDEEQRSGSYGADELYANSRIYAYKCTP